MANLSHDNRDAKRKTKTKSNYILICKPSNCYFESLLLIAITYHAR